MEFPNNLYYTKDHEWISAKEDKATVGISSYALEQLGDVVHIELPTVGDHFDSGESFGTIESTKTVSDLYLPLGGSIIAINEKIMNTPELLSTDPYESGWLVKIEINHSKEKILFNKKEYQAYLSSSI